MEPLAKNPLTRKEQTSEKGNDRRWTSLEELENVERRVAENAGSEKTGRNPGLNQKEKKVKDN